ncbi:MAG: SelB C-terminal domain-containing protein [Armatimonadetes bacterium]|nr:SelB C-terminal domain-containing protein [Armatimonadota bacterium]
MTPNAKQRKLLDRVIETLVGFGFEYPGERKLAETMGMPPQAVKEMLRIGLQLGELHQTSGDLVYSQTFIDRVALEMRAGKVPARFTVGDFKDAYDTSRKYVVPFLELLDRLEITDRDDDFRRMNG